MTREVEPRLMTRTDAAAYCAVTPSRFDELVANKVYRPTPFDATLFDRRVLDAAMQPAATPVKLKRIGNYRRKSTPAPVARIVKWTGAPLWARGAYFNARKNAARRGIEFDLTREQMIALVKRSEGRCEMSGIVFDHSPGSGFRRPFAPSLDRVRSSEPYTLNNVRLICVIANLAANEWGDETLMVLARALVARGEA